MRLLSDLNFAELKPVLKDIKEFEAGLKERYDISLELLYFDKNKRSEKLGREEKNNTKIIQYAFLVIEKKLGITKAHIESKIRDKQYVTARQILAKLLKIKTVLSLEMIGLQQGGRDHSTITEQLIKFGDKYDTDSSFRNLFAEIYKDFDDLLNSNKIYSSPELVSRKKELEEQVKILSERQISNDLSTYERTAIIRRKHEIITELEAL